MVKLPIKSIKNIKVNGFFFKKNFYITDFIRINKHKY